MADRRPADKKPKGSGNPNRINRLLVKKAETDYSKALADLQRATAATLRVNNVVVQNPVQQP